MVRTQENDVSAWDRRLHRLLAAGDDEAEREIERLILTVTRPVMSEILARYGRSRALFTPEDVADLAAGIDLRVLERLREMADVPHDAIRNLRGYAAALTYNAVSDFLRRRFPERARLKKRVLYALDRDERLALWNAERGPAGGLRAWEGASSALEEIPPGTSVAGAAARGQHHGDVLMELFDAVQKPVLVEAIVEFLDSLWEMSALQREVPLPEEIPSETPDAAAQAEDWNFACALWREVRELRPMQRKALLLNLRYGGDLDVLSVLMLSGIASNAELAAAVELSEAELLAIWKDLPLDDNRIAGMLGISRQQVINLRKAARARLSRRLPR